MEPSRKSVSLHNMPDLMTEHQNIDETSMEKPLQTNLTEMHLQDHTRSDITLIN